MAGGLLYEVQQNPSEREAPAVPHRLDGQLAEAGSSGDDVSTPLAGLAVAVAQLLGSHAFRVAELPVGICLPIDGSPGLALGSPLNLSSIQLSSTNDK